MSPHLSVRHKIMVSYFCVIDVFLEDINVKFSLFFY